MIWIVFLILAVCAGVYAYLDHKLATLLVEAINQNASEIQALQRRLGPEE